MFIEYVIADRTSEMNSEVHMALLSAQIQPNAAKKKNDRMVHHSTDG